MDIDTFLLKGQFVRLDTLKPDDREALRSLARDERIWEFTKTLIIDDAYDSMFDSYFNTAIDPNGLGVQQSFVVRRVTDDGIIGMTRLYEINPKEKTAVIGYTWYSPDVWGKVHNKECKLLLLSYVFEQLHFNRVELRVAHQNLRSQKAVEKIGGVREGVLRKHGYRNDGSIRHTVIFSIIDDEWPTVKEKLLQLIAENKQ